MSALDVSPEPPTFHRSKPRYEVSLEMRDASARVSLAGALNESSVDAVAGILARTAGVPSRVEIDFDAVTDVDELCFDLLIGAARQRSQRGLSPIVLVSASTTVIDAMVSVGLPGCPPISLPIQGIRSWLTGPPTSIPS